MSQEDKARVWAAFAAAAMTGRDKYTSLPMVFAMADRALEAYAERFNQEQEP